MSSMIGARSGLTDASTGRNWTQMAAQQTELVDFYVTPFEGADRVIRT